ncbi:tetratricopeptide repeat protein [Novosphingobium sp. TH158]|uniref:tetratricopeptide repeat protein n=1 Tax=Novosphingobium sp. TH158 TaxID=2067455 RepID=UPI001181A1D3|nr:tetratricopeptide repeat protein [Novosphingobium sp. TH158]
MRYTPAALALSLALTLTSSVLYSAPPQVLEPRAAALQAQGRAALEAGDINAAIDAYEAALTIQPGSVLLTLDLAEATRRQGLQGKALHYYRKALVNDPQNLDAIAGEGVALVEKGAVEKARRNLTRLQGLCGKNCAQATQLSAAIAKGPTPRVVTADAVTPNPEVSEN